MAAKKSTAKKAPKFKTRPRGDEVSWHYRSAIGHGRIAGVHKRGTTPANTVYSIAEQDHHVSATGSKEKAIVFHSGAALTSSSARAAKGGKSKGTKKK